MLEYLTSERLETKWFARNQSSIVQDGEWRTARKIETVLRSDGCHSYYENYVSRGISPYGG